jgi:hypothetical protein
MSMKRLRNGLNTAGVAAKGVAKEAIPIVEKSVSAVYNTMASGLNLGIKGAKGVGKSIKKGVGKGGKRRRGNSSRRRKH